MKYVRTKDGRIVDVSLMQEYETDDDNGGRIFDGYEDKDGTYYPVENIIKQADTIEELCDDFMCIKYGAYGKLHPWVLSDFEILKRENNYPTAQIYGAIWILDSNGAPTLKPVAKMNDKGELELL